MVPCVWANARNLSQPAIMEALRHGRVVVAESPTAPRLFLTVGGAGPGDTAAANGDPLPAEIRVTGGDGLTLRLVWESGTRDQRVAGDDFAWTEPMPADRSRPAYIRAELRHPDGRMCALTNPVYQT